VIPIGKEDKFEGIVDLMSMKAVRYDEEGNFTEGEVPKGMAEAAKRWRANLVEKCAEQDDALLEKFFETGDLSVEEMKGILRKATIARRIVPVFCGSAFKNKGVQHLLDGVVDLLPAPDEIPPIVSAEAEKETAEKEGADGKAVGEPAAAEQEAPAEPKAAWEASDDSPFSALAFKIVADKHAGKLTYIRIYSGVLTSGQSVWNSTIGKEQRIGRILRMHANHSEQLETAQTGDIVAVVGLAHTRTGDTLCTKEAPIHLTAIEFPAPVVSISIKPDSTAENDKLSAALYKLADEDPTFTVQFDQETEETVISGMGELHLEIIVDRLKREFGVSATVGRPEVAYRETGTQGVQSEYKHVKQSGGRGQYAHVCMRLEPLPAGSGFEFVNEVVGGRIPANFIPSVQKGVVKAMQNGPYAGYPVVDVRVVLFDGSFHEVDSSDFAFQEAGRACFRQMFLKSSPVILEPVMSVEATTPEEYMGAVTGSICQRRGRIETMEDKNGQKVIRGMVPLGEMFGYANTLRSLTQGRAGFSMQFEHYEAVPFFLTEQIIAARKKAGKVH
ncbi:MAG: elongation factor G, partial [Kiritimatiellae bacterium]|nr:elongation factor G [Kiritimatiellia bacterium]